jgi:glycerophosphoryl diester phosphodiesterase
MRNAFSISGVVVLLVSGGCSHESLLAGRHGIVVIGHRGDSQRAPENTLSAFRRAVSADADFVELDARLSADGTLYVLHDDTVNRTTDGERLFGRKKLPLRRLSDAEIGRLDAGQWFNEQFAGEPLPTLSAALDVIQAGSRTLLERKDGPAEDYVRLLRSKRLVGKLVVQSFDWDFLARMHELEPNQPLGALGDKLLDEQKLARLPSTGASVVAWNYEDVTADMVRDLHRRHYRVWVWTADEPSDWHRLISYGVDGIITNRPGELIKALRESPARTAASR